MQLHVFSQLPLSSCIIRERAHALALVFVSVRRLRELERLEPPHLGLHVHEVHGLWKIVVVHHLARRRRRGVRRLQHRQLLRAVRVRAREGQPAVEELGLQDGELALEERYLVRV